MSEDSERDLYVVTKFVRNPDEQTFKSATPERHFVQLPNYSEKGWYVNGLSMSAFRRRMQKRHIKSWKNQTGNWVAAAQRVSFWFRVEMKCDFDAEREIWAKTGVPEEPVLEFHHASLKAFYEHIGYDPKTNKLKVEPVLL